jgi:hypothetical protein
MDTIEFVINGISMSAQHADVGWCIAMKFEEGEELRFVKLAHDCGVGKLKARARKVINFAEYLKLEPIV